MPSGGNMKPLLSAGYSAGRISSRISDFGGEHSSGRIRYFRAKFVQNNGKSVALMMHLLAIPYNPYKKLTFRLI